MWLLALSKCDSVLFQLQNPNVTLLNRATTEDFLYHGNNAGDHQQDQSSLSHVHSSKRCSSVFLPFLWAVLHDTWSGMDQARCRDKCQPLLPNVKCDMCCGHSTRGQDHVDTLSWCPMLSEPSSDGMYCVHKVSASYQQRNKVKRGSEVKKWPLWLIKGTAAMNYQNKPCPEFSVVNHQ